MPTSPSGLTCNVATGSHHTLTQLLQSICTAVGREVEPILGPPRVGDIIDSRADIAAARQALDFSVSVSFDEGIARTMDWLRRALQV
jgi:UDP-glucose 4-epimerase